MILSSLLLRVFIIVLTFVSISGARGSPPPWLRRPESSDHSTSRLRSLLSSNASISIGTTGAPRWSTFDAPDVGTTVSAATEDDVRATVQYCIDNGWPFLAQGGGHGWISNFHMNSPQGVLINLQPLDFVTFSPDKKQVSIGGGALVSDVVSAAAATKSEVVVGNCNCIGALGATLGGGYGNLLGLYGFSVDNVLAMNVVLANGSMVLNLTRSLDPDLFWALLGAGPNFGIVTSAIMKAYPVADMRLYGRKASADSSSIMNGIVSALTSSSDSTSKYKHQPRTSEIPTVGADASKIETLTSSNDTASAWTGSLTYPPHKLEPLISAIDSLVLLPPMNVFLYFINSSIQAVPFFYGGDALTGRAAFAALFAVGPSSDSTSVVPYTEWNAAASAAGLCTKGARKPAYGAGLARMDPPTWRAVWDLYSNFSAGHGGETSRSLVLLEAYSLARAQLLAASTDSAAATSFANRDVRFNAVAIPWYDDPALDAEANAFAARVRNLWRATAGWAPGVNRTYVNFAHGDESPATVYGESLDRLVRLKRRFDPGNVFRHWLPLV